MQNQGNITAGANQSAEGEQYNKRNTLSRYSVFELCRSS